MNDLALTRQHNEVTPVTYANANRLVSIEPHAFLFAHLFDANCPLAVTPPGWAVLRAMQGELTQALAPCQPGQAAQAAALIIAGYPQRDDTSAAYAQLLVQRLTECPPDLLMRVVDAVIDANPSFRPGAGDVARLVRAQVAKRQRLLLQVEAALRYWTYYDAAVMQRQEIEADKRALGHDPATRLAAALRVTDRTPRSAPAAEPTRPRPKAAHLTPDQLRVARSAKSPNAPRRG